jgi:sRNA-binding regulator protein Hfq
MIYKTGTKPVTQGSRGMGSAPRLTKSLDLVYHKKHVKILFVDGTSIEGVVTRFTAYWLEVKLSDGRVVYVNKGPIKMIEVMDEKEGKNQAGGSSNENNRFKQK